jgi:hypothetical protein
MADAELALNIIGAKLGSGVRCVELASPMMIDMGAWTLCGEVVGAQP